MSKPADMGIYQQYEDEADRAHDRGQDMREFHGAFVQNFRRRFPDLIDV